MTKKAIAMAAFGLMTSFAAMAGSQVIFTGELGKNVRGYQGTTPLNITIENGKITNIEALENNETPRYFSRAKAGVFKQYIGLSVKEALNLQADAVTGATYSSEALIKNIQLGLKNAKTDSKSSSKKSSKKKSSKKRSSKKSSKRK